jgi:aminomethyltransferase
MAEFGGYRMPLWYSSAKGEHLAVLGQAGLFDTSHMAALLLEGPRARVLLQRCFSRDLEACIGPKGSPLSNGRLVYGVFLNDKGHVIDDAIAYQIAPEKYMLVVNAGMGGPLSGHLAQHAQEQHTQITDLSGELGKIDLQGPAAARILAPLLASSEAAFECLPYFAFKGFFDAGQESVGTVSLTDGTPLLLSRSGYTGEFGFEIFCRAEHTRRVWEQIMERGEPHGLCACGLAARDSLRAGAVLPLSHQDIGDWPFMNNPWTFCLPWNGSGDGFTKRFVGGEALLAAEPPGFTYPFVGRDPRKVSPGEATRATDLEGRELGRVLTCVTDMGIGWHQGRIYSLASPDKPDGFQPKGLCCGFVLVEQPLDYGREIQLRDARRKLPVSIAKDIRPNRTARAPIQSLLV